MKKIGFVLCAAMFTFCLALAGCSSVSSYEGAWYSYDENGSETVLTLDKNGTFYDTDDHAGSWQKVDAGFVIDYGYDSETYIDNGDGSVSQLNDDAIAFFKDKAKAQEAAEYAGENRANEVDSFVSMVKDNLIGTWQDKSNRDWSYSFNEDGTWKHVNSSDADAYSSNLGTWRVEYNGDETARFDYIKVKIKCVDSEGNEMHLAQVDDEAGHVTVDRGLSEKIG
ncbi:hypothetical protein [Eggerthella guodeyinii]|uniref:Lipoprotein n=1 Tax=Eggerthella guodeyinii TaxID=2690837 RepID=A0A6N7RRE3_9ACTN|nr:hypothetical protein [Eggerthella guodeyinii]MRX83953.1 hypothetical protein [Eggerthella guodeyinii]